jgi:hypothetical protein
VAGVETPIIVAHARRDRIALRIAGLCMLAAMLVAPIWIAAFPPLLDYPNHLARAFVLQHLRDPHFSFSQFYCADWGPYPYLGFDASLAVLDRILPIEIAGKVYLSICVLALPWAAWFFLREAQPESCAEWLWALLISYNVFFLEGFLNFALSIAVGFFALGLWMRWIKARSSTRWIAALVVFTALYFTHLLGFVIAGLIVGAYLLAARRPVRDWLWSAAFAIPAVALYFHSSRVGIGVSGVEFRNALSKMKSLGMILHGYWSWLDWLSLAGVGLWFVAAWWRNSEFRWDRKCLIVSVALLVLFFATPWSWGEGSDLDIRVLPFLFVIVLATARAGRRAVWLAAIPLLLFAARTASVTAHFLDAQPGLAGLARSFDLVPRNALVLPIVESDEAPMDRPFTHFWAYGVIRRGWFSPYLMDAPGETPMRIVHDSYTLDGFWDLTYHETPDWKRIQDEYDYVWAYDVARFSPGLDSIGERVYSYGPLEVYRIRKFSSGDQNLSP